MKLLSLYRAIFVVYLLTLLWMVLFKLSFGITVHVQQINLIPFANPSWSNLAGAFDNVMIFVPFGLLLSVNVKQLTFWQKLGVIAAFSVFIELTQYVFAIGVTDITDVTTNTIGGLLGLLVYKLGLKDMESEKLDRLISIACGVLLVALLMFRFFVLRMRY